MSKKGLFLVWTLLGFCLGMYAQTDSTDLVLDSIQLADVVDSMAVDTPRVDTLNFLPGKNRPTNPAMPFFPGKQSTDSTSLAPDSALVMQDSVQKDSLLESKFERFMSGEIPVNYLKRQVAPLRDRPLIRNIFPDPDTCPAPCPKAAWIRSAMIPAWGQAYNKRYWKVPIVYGVLGGLAFWGGYNHQQYKVYQRAYLYRTDGDSTTVDAFPNAPESGLLSAREAYRRNRDLTVIVGALAYGLNIIEAYVDAHLQHFDVSEDLSLKVSPRFLPPISRDARESYYLGVGIGLSF